MAKILVPVRYAAWLSGELGDRLHDRLQTALPGTDITRLPRGFLVTADEEPGVLLEAVHRAVHALEAAVQENYPVFHHEMGPVWTGTLQSVFPVHAVAPHAQTPAPRTRAATVANA